MMRDLLKLLCTFASALTLGGCAYTPRGDAPDRVVNSKLPLDAAVTCVIRSPNAEFPGSWAYPTISHGAVIVEPDRMYEVAPTRTLVVGGEMYFVRVSKDGDGSRLELYSPSAWNSKLMPALEACSGGAASPVAGAWRTPMTDD